MALLLLRQPWSTSKGFDFTRAREKEDLGFPEEEVLRSMDEEGSEKMEEVEERESYDL